MSFVRGNISVDRDFARFGAKSYAINKINTVEVREEPAKKGMAYLLLGLGALILIGSLGSLGSPDAGAGGFIFGFILLGLGVFALKRAHALYRLFLMTSSNEVQAYESKDQVEIMELRSAVEAAMMGR